MTPREMARFWRGAFMVAGRGRRWRTKRGREGRGGPERADDAGSRGHAQRAYVYTTQARGSGPGVRARVSGVPNGASQSGDVSRDRLLCFSVDRRVQKPG